MTKKNMIVFDIRHGVKQRVGDTPQFKKHITGTEATLDQFKIYLIENFARKISKDENTYVATYAPANPRNFDTAKIIRDTISSDGKKVEGVFIDERVSPFAGKKGKLVFMSSQLPPIWGNAEEKYQTLEGVTTENRGLYAWAEWGMDKVTDGISFREIAYRKGDFLLEKIDEFNQGSNLSTIVAISNSGFIEPAMWATLDMIEQKGKSPIDYFFETGQAVKFLEGLKFNYIRGESTYTMIMPNGKTKKIGLEILQEQKNWVKNYGIADKVIEARLTDED